MSWLEELLWLITTPGFSSCSTSNRMTHDPAPKQATNNQLPEMIRSHILAMRGEVTRRLEDIEERLERIELSWTAGGTSSEAR